jgi:hypothetical protein
MKTAGLTTLGNEPSALLGIFLPWYGSPGIRKLRTFGQGYVAEVRAEFME